MFKSNFIFTKEIKGDHLIFRFTGDLDKLALNENKHKINEDINNFEGSTIVFDFDSLTYINSESIGYLIEIKNYLDTVSKKIVLTGVKANIKDILNAIGISEVINIYDSLSVFHNLTK